MTPPLPFDTLYTIFSLLPSPGMLYSEDRRLYDAMDAVHLPVPLTNTKHLASCARVCQAWNAPAQPFLMRDIRIISHAQCTRLVELTSDPAIGGSVRTLEFVNGKRRPDTQTLKADITPRDVIALVKNCRRLRTLVLFGCPLFREDLHRLINDVSFDELTALGLSRQFSSLSMRAMKRLLDRMPQLRALACPALACGSNHLPPAPKNRLSALVTHQDSLHSFWLLNASAETLTCFDPEFHTREVAHAVRRALILVGHTVRRIRVPSAVFVPELLPLCPNLRHLGFPILETDFEPLLACIITPLESLTLFSDHYIGRKAKATLSGWDVRILVSAIETKPTFCGLKSLDLSLSYHEVAYPRAHAEEFTRLKEICARRGIRFPCPDVPRLVSGPVGANPNLYADIQDFEDSWA